MAAWLAGAALVVALALAGAAAMSRLYRTPRVPHARTPEDLGLRFEELRFPTARGRTLYGWWIPAVDGSRGGRPTVVLVHGWGRNVERLLPFVPRLSAAGFDLLAFDARSHGSSEPDGTANMLKFSEDVRAALDEAERHGASRDRLAVLGLSVGGAGCLHAAAHDDRVRAVVTVGAFAHPGDLMRAELLAKGVPAGLVALVLRYAERRIGERLDVIAPERQIGRIAAPVLLVHGEEDAVVPVAHARRLAAAGNENVRLLALPGRGHSDCDDDPLFWPAVLALLGERLGTGREGGERGATTAG